MTTTAYRTYSYKRYTFKIIKTLYFSVVADTGYAVVMYVMYSKSCFLLQDCPNLFIRCGRRVLIYMEEKQQPEMNIQLEKYYVRSRENLCRVRQCLEFVMTFKQGVTGCCSQSDGSEVKTLAVRNMSSHFRALHIAYTCII
jgi:hypothetical protein